MASRPSCHLSAFKQRAYREKEIATPSIPPLSVPAGGQGGIVPPDQVGGGGEVVPSISDLFTPLHMQNGSGGSGKNFLGAESGPVLPLRELPPADLRPESSLPSRFMVCVSFSTSDLYELENSELVIL